MKCLKRNERTIYYSLYTEEEIQYDSGGYETGEPAVGYSKPEKITVNVSPAMGQVNVELFGNSLDYDRVIVSDDPDCPVTETSVLYIDCEPDAEGSVPFDYTVKKIARSKNSVSIAVKRVEVKK